MELQEILYILQRHKDDSGFLRSVLAYALGLEQARKL